MLQTGLPEVGGYVLAGGKSSRMGTEKALIEMGGKPLVAHAVAKLRSICREVSILGSNPELARYAPLVPDLHPGCGPIGGIEAALEHSGFDWNLVVPVDVPFLPAAFLREWIQRVSAKDAFRVAYFEAAGKAQPGVLLIHREAKPSITAAIDRGEYKLLSALSAAASGYSVHVEEADAAQEYWFMNVNTPVDLEIARKRWRKQAD
jgi:molybdopterin-guanine dinucleotide biosynthesis protein A